MSFVKKYIGDRSFYKMVLSIAIPIMIQNGITNFVGLLDNIMVGQLGTEQMSGVSIINEFLFIFNLVVFGAVSAAGIYTAQYFGNKDTEGVKNTFKIKLIFNFLIVFLATVILLIFYSPLINMFLHDGSQTGNLELTYDYAKQYLFVMLLGLLPYALTQTLASTMRETQETIVPMVASIVAVLTNFLLNYALIFGNFGFVALGVEGAAIATVISRFLELGILFVWMLKNRNTTCQYVLGLFKRIRIPKELISKVIITGLPLIINELLWSVSVTMKSQCFSTRGLDVVAAQNIALTVFNVCSVTYFAMGTSISIIIGNLLGAKKFEEAKEQDRKLITFAVFCALTMTGIMIAFSKIFPGIYKTSDEVKELAAYMIRVLASCIPFYAFSNSSYFTLRSGGKIWITMLFDSGFMWAVVVPISAILAYCTTVDIFVLYLASQAAEILECFMGYYLVKKGNWAKAIV